MDDKDPEKDLKSKDEVICEFFGIKLTTKNPKLAKILTADVNEVLQLDVTEVKDFIKIEPADTVAEGENIDSKWSSISSEVNEINELLIDDEKNESDDKTDK